MISLWMSYGSSLNDLPRLPPGAVGPGSWSTPGMLREAWLVAAESLGGVVQHGGAGVRGELRESLGEKGFMAKIRWMVAKSCTTLDILDGWNPRNNRINHLSTGAGFRNHPQYGRHGFVSWYDDSHICRQFKRSWDMGISIAMGVPQ